MTIRSFIISFFSLVINLDFLTFLLRGFCSGAAGCFGVCRPKPTHLLPTKIFSPFSLSDWLVSATRIIQKGKTTALHCKQKLRSESGGRAGGRGGVIEHPMAPASIFSVPVLF